LALSYVTYVFIGWFKFLLLKFLYEYWSRCRADLTELEQGNTGK